MVLVNEKICDNAKECSGIEVCPTGAIFWDDIKEKICVNNDLCVSCRQCVTNGCPIGAIIVVDNQEDYNKEIRKIGMDEHTTEELFVERYGATPIQEELLIQQKDINKVLSEGEFVFVEKFNDDSIQCLLHSIPIHEIREMVDDTFNYYKCDVTGIEDSDKYPSLTIYYGFDVIETIEGYFDDEDKTNFVKRITEIMKKINK